MTVSFVVYMLLLSALTEPHYHLQCCKSHLVQVKLSLRVFLYSYDPSAYHDTRDYMLSAH